MSDIERPHGAITPDPIPLEPESTAQRSSKRGLIVGGVVLGVVVLVAVVAALAYRNLIGEPFAAAGAVPPDADIVVSFDLLQIRDTDRVDRLVRAFAEPLAEAGDTDAADFDLVEAIDEELETEFGVTLSDDVIPWIGRSVSIAAWVPQDFAGDPEVLASIAVRNQGAAAAFVGAVIDQASVDFGATVEQTRVREGDRWIITDDGDTSVVVWLGSDLMLLATSMRAINRALDAREGDSLLDEAAFNEVVAELPADRLATVFVGSQFFEALTDLTLSVTGEPSEIEGMETLEAMGIGFTLRDDGVQWDLAQVRDTPEEIPALEPPLAAISGLPPETLGYFAFAIPEGFVDETVIEALQSADPDTFESFTDEASEMLGVDLFDSLLPALGGDSFFGVVEERSGIVAEEAGVPLGLIGALGVVDSEPVATALDSVEGLIEDQGLVVVGDNPKVVVAEGDELLAYGLTDRALVLGTPPVVVADYLAGPGGLTDTTLYRDLDAALVGDGLSFYVDLASSLALAREFEPDLPNLPLRAVGASGAADGRITRGSLLILIDY